MTTAEKERLLGLLPTEPPEWLKPWVGNRIMKESADLGEEYLIYRGVRMTQPPDMWELFDNHMSGKKRWMAECYCTACGETTYTDKTPEGVVVNYSEDGYCYSDIAGTPICEEDELDCGRIAVADGENVNCPLCQENVRLIHSKRIGEGKTKQVMVMTVDRIEKYAVLMCWMVSRSIYQHGTTISIRPFEANVIDEEQRLIRYSHSKPGCFSVTHGNAWTMRAAWRDPGDIVYQSWEAIDNRMKGYWTCEKVCSLVGTTAEKTGLHSYVSDGGQEAALYLESLKRFPKLENLVHEGCTALISEVLSQSRSITPLSEHCDLTQKKPHAMFGFARPEFVRIRDKGELTMANLRKWKRYRGIGGKCRFEIATKYPESMGGYHLFELLKVYGDDYDKVTAYLTKQKLEAKDASLLVDARKAAKKVYRTSTLTEEEKWPTHLQEFHDRMNEMLVEIQQERKKNGWQTGFDMVCADLAPVVYNDGNLIVTLPTTPGDLIREGKVLRHCVGTYCEKHAQGVSVILFVRHYRRPERPYYTLNIHFGEEGPTRVQLHGYGNERHGKNKEHTHRIPQAVRDFCDYWETNILLPWWQMKMTTNKERSA